MLGSLIVRTKLRGSSTPRKLFSLLLTLVLVIALVPSAAWAQTIEHASLVTENTRADTSTPAPGEEALDASSASVTNPETSEPTPDAAQTPSGEGSSESVPQNGGQSSDAVSETPASPSVALPNESSESSPTMPAREADVANAFSVDEDSYVLIQDAQDKDNNYSKFSGALSPGSTLWANIYDYYSDSSIDHETSWSYQWMYGASASADTTNYTPIEGQTSQSLVVTEELVAQIAGSYVVVKVTADGRDFYGPGRSYGTGLDTGYVPGPVLKKGQASLYSVSIDTVSPSVGNTLTATANASYGKPVSDDVAVTFSWYSSSTRGGRYEPIADAQGSSITATEVLQNRYLKVEATAGVNTVSATTSDAVLASGAFKLGGVELVKPASLELGATLEAKAYTGSSYAPTYITEGITYTWKYAETASYSTVWSVIPEATTAALTVSDNKYIGKYISVSANAGANTVDLSSSQAFGPVRLAGAVEIYAASLTKNGESTNVFAVGDTVVARAREKAMESGEFIAPDKLNFQWQVSSDGKAFANIPGQTAVDLMLDASYEGKYVKCIVSAKIGTSSYATQATKSIGDAGSLNIVSVTADRSGNVYPGDTIVARAQAGSNDVTASQKVAWSWYWGTTASSVNTRIEGANTSALTITEDMMGGYVAACANGGFGDIKSSKIGPVIQKGAFSLYKVEASGSPEVGKTLTALSYSDKDPYRPVPDNAAVSYQWQYANTNTTTNAAFSDIAGATGKTYEVAEDMLSKYLRVKATSLNSAVSTSKPYYGSTQPVDPVGPVKLAGAYNLSSIKLASSGQAMQVGNTITPTAQYKDGYYESSVPADAKVTYTWQVSDTQTGDFAPLTVGVDASGKLTLDSSLVGKWVKASAHALVNDVSSSAQRVLAAGEYDLLRVTLAPNSENIFTESEITAGAQAKNLTSISSGDDVSSNVALVWSICDTKDGEFTPLSGFNSKTISIPSEAAGKFLKVTAISGSSSVEAITAQPLIGSDTLEGAAKKLDAQYFKASPVYGKDTNINKVVKAKLAELGYDDIAVTTKAAKPRATNEHATVGVSVANDATNGSVAYFFMDPDKASSSYISYTTLCQFDFAFEFSRGNETYDYQPNAAGTIPWDEARVSDLLDQKAAALEIGFAVGDTMSAVSKNLVLPYKLKDDSGTTKSWSSVAWASSDKAVLDVQGNTWSDRVGKITRMAADRTVELTATITIVSSGGPATAVEKTFEVTVKGDPQKVEAEKAALEQKVQANFTHESIKPVEAGAEFNKDAVEGDMDLPTPSTMGVDGKYYAVTYASSSDAVEINTYRGNVFHPLPGAEKAPVYLAVTITDKANPEITATKTLSVQVAPLDQGDLDSELALMDAAKAGYSAALSNGQDQNAVTQNLHAFQKAYFDGAGLLAWSYDRVSTDATGSGIVPADLEGYDPMGSEGWRLFKSSKPTVVTHENLLVKQPEYNTKVTLTSSLSSEKYARYAARYPENEAFQKLANQNISTTLTVKGLADQVAPTVTATCSVLGVDKGGTQQTWAAAMPYTLANGATAAQVSEAMFKAAGLTADFGVGQWGWALNSLTSPFDAGQKLAWGTIANKGWSYYVNGKDPGVGAGDYRVQPGDSIIWRYGAWDDPAPTDELSVTCSVIGADSKGARQTWAAASTLAMSAGSTAADLSEALFRQAGLSADTGVGDYGWFLNSITSPFTDESLGSKEVSPGVWSYWQLFINGQFATVGAGGYTLQAGDEVTWCYGSDETLPGQVAAACEVVGADAQGNAQTWATEQNYVMLEGATAADISEQVFLRTGLSATIDTTYGWYLDSVTSPYDVTVKLGWDQASGKYWRLFINGEPALDYANDYRIQAGDALAWYYSAETEGKLPDGSVVIDPDAQRPSYDSSWSGFGGGTEGGAVVARPTPTESTQQSWSYSYANSAANVSDPLVVNGDIYLVVSGELQKIDAATGHVKAKASIGGAVSYLCRPVYSAGVIVVPLDGGSLAAFTADKLTCVWKTASLSQEAGKYQALSSLTVNEGRVYAAFTAVGAGGIGSEGVLVCVEIASGNKLWEKSTGVAPTGSAAGYYWAGAAVSGSDLVIGDESGKVSLIDGLSGETKASLALGASCRAGIVAIPSKGRALGLTEFLAVTTNGSLHKIVRRGDTLLLAGSVSFANKSTSTPAVTNGKAFVGAVDQEGYGTLSVIDVDTMTVDKTVRGGKGEAQGAPLVSVQGGGTYAYFTCNGVPGGVYGYRLGDESASALFTPPAGQQGYTLASIVTDEQGNLYYTNDSGTLFALAGKPGARVSLDSNGGSYVAPNLVALGSPMIRPADPTRFGYTFAGWYADKTLRTSWDFSTPITQAMTLYAKWNTVVEKGEQDESGGGPTGGSNMLPGVWAPLGGAIPPTHAPLIPGSQNKNAVAVPEATEGIVASGRATSASGGGSLNDGSAATVGAAPASTVNPWAVGGLGLGAVGLVCALMYVARARRRTAGK